MPGLTSAAGIIALLDEPQDRLKVHALEKLNDVVDSFWAEVADAVSNIEVLYENEEFSHRNLAALVASKVYYHLGAFDDAMTFALGAGDLFDVFSKSEFVETITTHCIDTYIRQRVERAEASSDADLPPIDPCLATLVCRIFDRCFHGRQYKHAIGVALESRHLDYLERAILESDAVPEMLRYATELALSVTQSHAFRAQVLEVLVNLYKGQPSPDLAAMCQCMLHLDDADSVARVLRDCVGSEGDEKEEAATLLGYQIAFDLVESATQQFRGRVRDILSRANGGSSGSDDVVMDGAAAAEGDDAETKEKEEKKKARGGKSKAEEKLDSILSGEVTVAAHLEFLFRNNHSDLLILNNIKTAVQRNSVAHSAAVLANCFMHAGTTADVFLRENLEWLGRATNWAKFSATASLGIIHRGHVKEAMQLLQPYLPQSGVSSSPYSEGGSLYALGLINANNGQDISPYLVEQLHAAGTEIVQHGACLGLGLAGLATSNENIYEELRNILYTDSAVAGEAAGLSMGLVMLGSGSAVALEEMTTYAHETQHEKIIRGLAVGISMVVFGREAQADALVEQLVRDKDPVLRGSAMHCIAMAYCGTGNNRAIRRLLHVAVSDVSDDVRRAAVTAIGFVLCRSPKQTPSVVSLLSESYNAHVRYGAAMALGISCAGTANEEAVALLEPMAKNDPIDYVRQGALLALSLILVQQNETMCPKSASIRELYAKVTSDKHEDVMAKYGAILAQGIIDAGGRNVTISLQSPAGHLSLPSVVGLMVFTQFWFWFPFAHFLGLAFTPTALIGVNKELKMPKLEFMCQSKASHFAYPPLLKPPEEKEVKKVSTAVLSVTERTKAKARKADEKKKGDGDMDVDGASEAKGKAKGEAAAKESKEAKEEDKDKMDVDTKEGGEGAADKDKAADGSDKSAKAEPEPSTHTLNNPARVLPLQRRYVSLTEGSRYAPMRKGALTGMVVLRDSTPGEDEELVKLSTPTTAATANGGAGGGGVAGDADEPEPPEPFAWTDEMDED